GGVRFVENLAGPFGGVGPPRRAGIGRQPVGGGDLGDVAELGDEHGEVPALTDGCWSAGVLDITGPPRRSQRPGRGEWRPRPRPPGPSLESGAIRSAHSYTLPGPAFDGREHASFGGAPHRRRRHARGNRRVLERGRARRVLTGPVEGHLHRPATA